MPEGQFAQAQLQQVLAQCRLLLQHSRTEVCLLPVRGALIDQIEQLEQAISPGFVTIDLRRMLHRIAERLVELGQHGGGTLTEGGLSKLSLRRHAPGFQHCPCLILRFGSQQQGVVEQINHHSGQCPGDLITLFANAAVVVVGAHIVEQLVHCRMGRLVGRQQGAHAAHHRHQLGVIVAVIRLPGRTVLAAHVSHQFSRIAIEQIHIGLLGLGAEATVGAAALQLLLLAGQHYGAIEHPALLPLFALWQGLPLAACDRVLVAAILQHYLNLAACGDHLTADAIADGVAPLLALLRLITLLLWGQLIQLPLIAAPDVDLADLSGSLAACNRLQTEEDLLQPAIPLAGCLFKYLQLLPILRLIVPLRLGAAALRIEFAAIQLPFTLTQDDGLRQRQAILPLGGRRACQLLPATLLEAVTEVITAGGDELARRNPIFTANEADLPARIHLELRLATLLFGQCAEIAALPVEAAVDPKLLIGRVAAACLEFVGDFGDASGQLPARFASQLILSPVIGGVVGLRRGCSQKQGACQQQPPGTRTVHFYPFVVVCVLSCE